MSENVAASISHKPKALHRPVQGKLYLYHKKSDAGLYKDPCFGLFTQRLNYIPKIHQTTYVPTKATILSNMRNFVHHYQNLS
jgi:hypothetical protein